MSKIQKSTSHETYVSFWLLEMERVKIFIEIRRKYKQAQVWVTQKKQTGIGKSNNAFGYALDF